MASVYVDNLRFIGESEDVEYASFAIFEDASGDYYPLNKEDQWLADTTNALYPVDENGEITSKDKADGVEVFYDSGIVCKAAVEAVVASEGVTAVAAAAAENYALKFDVRCDGTEATFNEYKNAIFLPAVITGSDLSACAKTMSLTHHTGCYQYSALGFVNFLNSNVWLSGTLLLAFGLCIGLFGQKWFLKITGSFAGLCAFVAFMILASIFQWLNTTVGLIICGIFAIAAGVLAYWFLSREGVATMFLCIGGGFMLGSIVEGLIIAISGWESMVFYIIVTAACMVIGGLIGCQKPDLVKKYLTAVVGSYIFMRGWTYFLGGYPSEMEMYSMMANPDSAELDFTGLFWFYVALFGAGIVAFVYIQSTWAYAKNDNSEDKDSHYKH
jgi:hypothetical protein